MTDPNKGFDYYLDYHRKVETKLKEMDLAYEAQIAPYKQAREKVRAKLLDMLNQSGQDTSTTEQGTVSKTTKFSASLEDRDAFMRHVIGAAEWDLLDVKANVTACQDFAVANKELPPGVKLTQKVDISVRAPAKSKTAAKARQAAVAEAIAAE